MSRCERCAGPLSSLSIAAFGKLLQHLVFDSRRGAAACKISNIRWAQFCSNARMAVQFREACRWPAYSMGRDATFDAVLRLVESYNATHNSPPLGHRECRHIALSISNYVLAGKRKGHSMTDTDWRQWVEHTHTSEVQARRGALGGKASGETRRAASEQERATARLIRASGSSYGVISQVLGIPESTIKRWCKN